jgi:hypothetical protein
MELSEKPRYGQLTVSDDLILNFDMDDTWLAIKDALSDDCDCVMVGLSEIDALIEKLQEAKSLLSENAPDKLLKYAEVIQILENEIKWCIDNPDKAFTNEYRKGFINGLIQAKSLVTKLAYLQDGETRA